MRGVNKMSNQTIKHINDLVTSIKNKHSLIASEAKRLKALQTNNSSNKSDPNFWCTEATKSALVKLGLIIENNFNSIESMGVLATTRYIFELSVWIKLFNLNSYYGLFYYDDLVKTQEKYWKNQEKQILTEIKIFKEIASEENELLKQEINKVKLIKNEEDRNKAAYNLANTVQRIIDDKAARHFSIYAEQAKMNGYSFQAHLIEQQILPQIKNKLITLKDDLLHLDKIVLLIQKEKPELIAKKKLELKNITWSEKAKLVNMKNEYDFIYSLTSTLLHATPSSLTTNMMDLDLSEILIFLKFINVSIQDIIDLAKTY